MLNCNLAASGNVSINEAPHASQLAGNARGWLQGLISAVKSFDDRAQKFFNNQATVRSQKPVKSNYGWTRYDGFK